MDYDLLILGGDVADGTGSALVRADVGIRDGKIVDVGNLSKKEATEKVTAEGRVVAPGFIDIHTHDDFNLPLNPLAPGKVLQGVTTLVTGNCGFSPAPLVRDKKEELEQMAAMLDTGIDYNWESFGEFLEKLPPLGVNMAPLVGHGTLRCGAMGLENRPVKPLELERMESLLAEALEAGAFGFSTGLIYPPSGFAQTDEIARLAMTATRFNAGYYTHMRDEGAGIMDSIEEAITIGRRSGVHVQLSHLKLMSPANWGRASEVLALIDKTRSDGQSLACDQYPYTAASTGLSTMLPDWFFGHEGGIVRRLQNNELRTRVRGEILEMVKNGASRVSDFSAVVVAQSSSQPDYAGMNLVEIGEREAKDPVDAMLDLLVADKARTLAVFFAISEEDMFQIMRHPAVAIGSDGIFTGIHGKEDHSKPHPRYFGTFPRVAGRYTREGKLPSLGEAIRKMTTLPANILGLRERGRLKPGQAADVVIFDPKTLMDTATFEAPHGAPEGMDRVIINGVTVAEQGRITEATPGTILRRGIS